MIPECVIEALAEAREQGSNNMLDRNAVIKELSDWDEYPEAVLWLLKNESEYMDALIAMGEQQ